MRRSPSKDPKDKITYEKIFQTEEEKTAALRRRKLIKKTGDEVQAKKDEIEKVIDED